RAKRRQVRTGRAWRRTPEGIRHQPRIPHRAARAAVTCDHSQAAVHRALEAAWAPKKKVAVGEVIRTALVLCADHELNVSAFTARCAASAGASPYDAISAAMATLKGHKHGGATERV